MIGTDLLLDVVIVEVAVLIVALAALFGHGLFLHLRELRYGRLVKQGRRILGEALQGSVSDEEVRSLSRMPTDVQLRLFLEVAPALLGLDRQRLAGLAARIGLDSAAEKQLSHRAWWRRLRALRVLTLIDAGSEKAAASLDDDVPEVAAQAADWSAEHPTPEIIEKLILMLADERVMCRFAVQDALLRIGGPTITPLATFLRLSDDGLLPALRVAAKLADPAFLEGSLRLSEHPDAGVRVAAAEVLGGLGGREAADRLLALLGDESSDVRSAAAKALGYMGYWPAAPELARSLSDNEWDVRRAAGGSLARLGAPGLLMLRKASGGEDRFASDMALHILDLTERTERVGA